MSYILLLLGFVLLIKGADYFVDGASSIAKILHVPGILIGLTIVAFGTSAPEAAVSISSALKGANDIALGNVIGSNLFNFLCVVGVASAITALNVKRSLLLKELPFTVLSCVVLIVLVFDTGRFGTDDNMISRQDGILLLLFFSVFMYYLIETALTVREENTAEEPTLSMIKSILFCAGGILGIIFGGNFVVDSASAIAESLGMSENLVGLTIVSIGTSLPELVTSITAARKGESDIALGNVIGSNLFNVFFILGISAAIHPIAVSLNILTDSIILLAATLLTFLFAITKKRICRMEGVSLFILYACYMAFILIRQ